MTRPLTSPEATKSEDVGARLDKEIEQMVDEYRSAVLLASQDLTNDKAISLVAYATLSLRGKIKALAQLKGKANQ